MSDELLLKIGTYIVPIASFISGFFMLRYSLKLKKKLRQRKEDCSVATKGTIVKVIKKYNRLGDSTSRHIYIPVYEYMANGEQITVKSEYGSFSFKTYQVGMQAELYYNPQNPTEFYVPADNADSIQIRLFGGGLLFLFLAVFTLISVIFLTISGNI